MGGFDNILTRYVLEAIDIYHPALGNNRSKVILLTFLKKRISLGATTIFKNR